MGAFLISNFMLTQEQVSRFQKLHKKRFGTNLSFGDAYEKGNSLVRMIELTYKPMTENEFKKLKKRKKELITRIIIQILTSYEIT